MIHRRKSTLFAGGALVALLSLYGGVAVAQVEARLAGEARAYAAANNLPIRTVAVQVRVRQEGTPREQWPVKTINRLFVPVTTAHVPSFLEHFSQRSKDIQK